MNSSRSELGIEMAQLGTNRTSGSHNWLWTYENEFVARTTIEIQLNQWTTAAEVKCTGTRDGHEKRTLYEENL